LNIYRQESLYIYMSFRASLLITARSWYLGKKTFLSADRLLRWPSSSWSCV